jgi:hypothetical protein
MNIRWTRSRTLAALSATVATVATIVVAGGQASPAMADNDGRRICIYGDSHYGDGTKDVYHFAVANYKRDPWSAQWDCPGIPEDDRGAFLAAAGWDANTSKWSKPDPTVGYLGNKVTCESFLNDELRGTFPKDVKDQRPGNFCDNIAKDVLYDFSVTVSYPDNSQTNVEVTATNTKVALKL